MKNNDNLFVGKEIFTESFYVRGIYPAAAENSNTARGVLIKNDGSEKRAAVIELKFGNAYEIKFSEKPKMLRTSLCKTDPRDLEKGAGMAGRLPANLKYYEGEPTDENVDFLCVPTPDDKYLVILTGEGENMPFSVTEHPILLGHDTDDCWFYCPEAGDVLGNENSWGDYRWSSDELFEKIYEPLREKHPEYITRKWIGKEHSNKYDMWAYIFEPEDYEQALFITAGLHGEEIDSYLSLARFLQYMTENGMASDNEGLKYLREKVKLIVIPVVNPWATHETHLRLNSSQKDLNRDFEFHTQAETINVIWLIHQYKHEIASLLDFHNAPGEYPGLFYQFSIQASNSAVCRKIANHIQEDRKAKGWEKDPADLWLIPGAYNKTPKYLQGYTYNTFSIPTLVSEHNVERWYDLHTEESFIHGVECFGNIIIQTALAKLKILK